MLVLMNSNLGHRYEVLLLAAPDQRRLISRIVLSEKLQMRFSYVDLLSIARYKQPNIAAP